jgi:hypothetical protein
VTDVRFRNEDEGWGDWVPVAAAGSWSLLAEEGLRTVTAEFRDAAGNVSDPASDMISLDTTPPDLSVLVNDGAGFTGSTRVTVEIEADDGEGSGVAEMRLKSSVDPQWGGWGLFEESVLWTISPGDGGKGVDVQVRDLVGNVSGTVGDSIILDQTGPSLDSFRINEGRPYVLPTEDLEFEVHARDNLGGSGVEGLKASFDGGSRWSEWYPLVFGYADVGAPDVSGLLSAMIVVRDKVGNESEVSAPTAVYLIEDELPHLGAGAKFAGGMTTALDVDALSLDLVKGDLLSVKIKAKASAKRKSLDLALDLIGPGGERLFLGRHPADARKLSILGYELPVTGRYLLVVRREKASEAERGTYKLKAKVKQAKSNKKGKGEFTGREILFDAVRGSTFKASVKGEGLTPDAVTLVGPEGEVAIERKGKPGRAAIKPVVLDAGTGTYAIRFDAQVTVVCKWSLKLPKIKGTIEE